MELRHLRYFVVAAEEEHFGRAAELLFVTRPAVSQTISDLEAELGVKLFVRSAQKVTLTAAGAALMRHARILLQDLSHVTQMTRRIGQGKAGPLDIGYSSLCLLHPLFRATIRQVRRDYPDVELNLREMLGAEQVAAIRSGKLEAGFVFSICQEKGDESIKPEFLQAGDLNALPIQEVGLAVAMPKGHAFSTRSTLELSEIAGEDFIAMPGAMMDLGQGIRSIRQPYVFTPHIVLQVTNMATQLNLVAIGMGMGLVLWSPELQFPSGVDVVPLVDVPYRGQLNLIWRSGQNEPLLQTFVETVETLASNAES